MRMMMQVVSRVRAASVRAGSGWCSIVQRRSVSSGAGRQRTPILTSRHSRPLHLQRHLQQQQQGYIGSSRAADVARGAASGATPLRARAHTLHTTSDVKSEGQGSRANDSQEERVLLYEAPIARPVRTLKIVSVTSAALTMVFLPASIFVGNPEMTTVAKLALGGTVCCFAAATTGALHWATKSYVRNITVSKEGAAKLQSGEDCSDVTLTAETLTFFGGLKETSFKPRDVTYPTDDPAFKSFFVNGRSYFVHGEVVGPKSPLRRVLKQLKTG